jgi:mannosyltransferase
VTSAVVEVGASSRPRAPRLASAEVAAAVALTAVAAALRFARLGAQSFWYDEAVSAQLARASVWELATGAVRDHGNPPLHSVLLHLWSAAFGTTDAALRALSAALGAATIPLFFVLARRLVRPDAALLATGLLAAAPFQIYLGQEARTFALTTFLAVAATLLLARAAEARSRPARWIAYGVAAFALPYAHYVAGFLLVAHAVWVFAVHRRDLSVVRGAACAWTFSAALFATWIPAFLAQLGTPGNLARSEDSWHLHLLATPLVWATGTTLTWKGDTSALRLVLAGSAAGALLGAVAWALVRARRGAPLLIVSWAAVPPSITVACSLLVAPIYNVRYLAWTAPAYYLLASIGLVQARRTVRLTALAVVGVAAVASLARYHSRPVKHEWRRTVSAIEARAATTDVVLFDQDTEQMSWERYATRDLPGLRLLPSADASSLRGSRARGGPIEDLTRDVASHPRAWLVLSGHEGRRDARVQWFTQRGWAQADDFQARGIEALLFVRPP